MGKEVPLVIYVDGERRVIGTAEVQEDGTVRMVCVAPNSAIIVGAFAAAGDEYSLAMNSAMKKQDALQLATDEFPKTGPWSRTVPWIRMTDEMQETVQKLKDNLDRDGD